MTEGAFSQIMGAKGSGCVIARLFSNLESAGETQLCGKFCELRPLTIPF